MAVLPQALEMAGAIQKDRSNGQLSFFDVAPEKKDFKKTFEQMPDIAEWPEYQLLSFEKQMLGFYITGHPLAKYEDLLRKYRTCSSDNLAGRTQGERLFIGGIIEKVKYTTTRKNEKMAILTLEDLQGTISVVVFPRTFNQCFKYIAPNALVFIRGNLDFRGEEPQIIAEAIMPLEEACEKSTASIEINIGAGAESGILDSVRSTLLNFSGDIPVFITLHTKERKKARLLVDREYYVRPCPELISEIEKNLGEAALSVKVKSD
jgi:DNA polymerase-3 subunit alpha